MSKNNDNTVTKTNELEIQINDFTKGNQIEILQNISSHYWNGFANTKLKLVISITVIQIVFFNYSTNLLSVYWSITVFFCRWNSMIM